MAWPVMVIELLEPLLSLVTERPWLSIALCFLVIVLLAAYIASILTGVVSQIVGVVPHLRRRYVWIPVIVGLVGMFALSIVVVDYLKSVGLPVPRLSTAPPVIGDDDILQWKLPAIADRDRLIFEVQSSGDAWFADATTVLTSDTVYPLTADRDQTLFWRVRAVEVEPRTNVPKRYGVWSSAVRVPQYRSVLERVRRTRTLNVVMDNEFGWSSFRWLEQHQAETPGTAGAPQLTTVAYKGVEIDLAYALADDLCKALVQDQQEGSRRLHCLPARRTALGGLPDACARPDVRCVAIDVRITPVPFVEVMDGVGRGTFDVAISSLTYIPKREEDHNILFGSEVYEQTGHSFIGGGRDRIPSGKPFAAASDLAGRRIAAQPTSSSQLCLLALKARLEAAGDRSFEIVNQSRHPVAVGMLLRGKASFDYLATDGTFADSYQRMHDELSVHAGLPSLFGAEAAPECRAQEYRMAMRAGEYDLQRIADATVTRLRASGQLDALKAKAATDFVQFVRRRRPS